MKVRFLESGDLAMYRDLRLAGLQESPTAFGSSHADEVNLPLSDFAARLRSHKNPDNGIFGAFLDGGVLAGVLGFASESRAKRAHIASLFGMYVSPEFRCHGVGGALLDFAIQHARKVQSVRQIILCVTASNVAACSLYRSRAFQRFGLERDALCIDGTYFDEEHLVLFLNERV